MRRGTKVAIWISAAVVIGGLVLLIVDTVKRSRQVRTVEGAVLRRDARNEAPVAGVKVTVAGGLAAGAAESDATGYFHLRLKPGVQRGQTLTLQFRRAEYEPLDMTAPARDQIYIARLAPIAEEAPKPPERPSIRVDGVKVRYATRATTTVNVGSAVKTFEVANAGNVPCNDQPPCSPDGKWKANIGSTSLDAGAGNAFRNARVSCIAGPCPFARIESDNSATGGQTFTVSARNWSDTVTFLVEAEVTHTMESDMIRESYPAIFGSTMDFTLPPTAEGPSILADMNGAPIVFPLGPALNLSWAKCELETSVDRTRLYRCELKPGYRFK